MSLTVRVALIGALAFMWFAFLQPWGFFVDPDAFYHAKATALVLEQGPLKAFPWLDLTAFGKHFADHHFLFHILLLPFVSALGALFGTQFAAVVLATACIVALYLVLRALRVNYPAFWTFLATTSLPLIIRLSLAKASPVALLLFLLGMLAQARHKRLLGFAVGAGFALSHGGWIILLGSQALFILGTFIFSRFVEDKSWKVALRATNPSVFLWSTLGAVVGTVLHPNFPQNIWFLWVQVVKIGLGTPFHKVTLGMEWLPVTGGELLAGLGPFAIAFILIVFGLLFARRPSLDLGRARESIAFALPVAVLFALTLKSQRTVEYLVPALTLWCATLATLIEPEQFKAEMRHAWSRTGGRFAPFLFGFTVCAILTLFVHDAVQTHSSLAKNAMPFQKYAQPMRAIEAEARPGERIFHSDWDEFPALFFQNDRFHYVSGLDPTFLLEANPILSDAYREITLGHVTSGLYEAIHDGFGSRIVFIDRANHEAFEAAMNGEPRALLLYEDPEVVVYKWR